MVSPTWVGTSSYLGGLEDPDFVPWVILTREMNVSETPECRVMFVYVWERRHEMVI